MRPLIPNILLALLPSIVFSLAVLRTATGKIIGTRYFLTTLASGYFVVLPAFAAQMFLRSVTDGFFDGVHPYLSIAFRAFVIAALTEEGAKLAVAWLSTRRRGTPRGILEAVVLATTAGLGFALFENITYSFDEPSVVILRGLTAVPLHLVCSGIMGFGIGISRIGGRTSVPKAFAVAAAVHGLYDLLLLTGGPWRAGVLPLLVVSAVALLAALRRFNARERGEPRVGRGDESPQQREP